MSDIIEVQPCPICGKGLNVSALDTVNYNGQLIHAECIAAADAQNAPLAEGYNPNNSYT
jgi:hypothetical protein